MFGNVINNSRVKELVRNGEIKIDPFYQDRLKFIHYPLTPYTLLKPQGRGIDGEFRIKTIHQYQTNSDFYVFAANEYLIVEIEEYISVPAGIVGHFVPSSSLIHQGFGLTAGRIEYPFGQEPTGRIKVRFGLKNLLDRENSLIKSDIVAYVYFVDLRGLNSFEPEETERDRVLFDAWKRRKSLADDDGPRYQD